ncbi:FadR family transcriptional regulator [Aureimonas flava]|uniref:FadR family transcriptional regulator n=1 Tax=Aureimonas flava TaxID=2320271 RepID=A0A3A1WNG0_9HYPH|nr:FadR/GntR family transcriptional regulator [Aureimonas flava]RIY01403.1 FadR family transcriptional regulator [Aureimonas flava]
MERRAATPRRNGESLSEGVYGSIRARIDAGEFPQGSLLPREDELALAFGVSRTVLREALTRLRHDGLIASKRGTGNRVLEERRPTIFQAAPAHSIADLEACYKFRYGVEPEIAALAAERADREATGRIEASARRLEAVVASGHLGPEHDLAFHAAVAEATRNSYYIQTIAAIAKPVEVGLKVAAALSPIEPVRRLTPTITEHRAILSAIEAGDPNAARLAMQAHIRASRERVFVGAAPAG